MNHFYLAYGLQIKSDTVIPGLREVSTRAADLDIHVREEPAWLQSAAELPAERKYLSPGKAEYGEPIFILDSLGEGKFFRLSYSDGTTFVCDAAATKLWGRWTSPWAFEDLVTYLLGPVMGFLLRQRGIAPLHASSVEISGSAMALVGPAGAGKSTTAAALALRGFPVLCEDVSPLTEHDGEFFIEPGYPRACLWPDAVEKLFGSTEALPRLTPNWDKCYLALDVGWAAFSPRRLPLAAIYFLSERTNHASAPRIMPMSPREALLELVQNTYMNYVLSREARATEFEVLGRLAQSVATKRIVPHSDARRLPQLCELLAEDTAAHAARACAATSSISS